MLVMDNPKEVMNYRDKLRGSVGFVPTMGALHEGHLSLIKRAREENDYVIVSVFVNPTQFLEGEDLDKYPKREEKDKELCKIAGVDLLFMPSVNSIYEADELKISAPKIKGYILEGAKRPGHFDGMLQVVMKLLNIANPTRAYFGKKDAQQLVLIEQMVRNYFIRTEITSCEIVRDIDGLALSSRNVYLSSDERDRALSISRSLQIAKKMIEQGEVSADRITKSMREILEPEVDNIEYIAIVNRDFESISTVELNNTIILVAVRVGTTRLIDNLWI